MVRVSGFSVEKNLSHRSEKNCREIYQCFINIGYRKMLGRKGGGGKFTFFRRCCCLRVQKDFVEQIFCAAFENFSVSEKVYG